MKQTFTLSFIILTFAIALLLPGCQPDIEPPSPSGGTLNFSRYLAFGGSVSAGLSNAEVRDALLLPTGGLYAEAQKHCFPSILASRIALVDSIQFMQATAQDNGSSYVMLDGFRNTCSQFPPTPRLSKVEPSVSWPGMGPAPEMSAIHNWSIPHLKIQDIHRRETQNPYFRRMAPDSMSYYDLAVAARPSFFTLWMGMEDILPYIYLGGKGPGPTDVGTFQRHLSQMLEALLAEPDAKGVVANIPDLTQMPFCHAVKDYVHDLDCNPGEIWVETCSAEVVLASPEDYVLFTGFDQVLGQIGFGWGSDVSRPVPNKYVLDRYEAAYIRASIEAFNEIIRKTVEELNVGEKRLALVDAHALVEQVHEGMYVDGIQVDASYVQGGFFSLDGLFPTGQGNALIANAFIEAINETFDGVSIPPADFTRYPGVRFP